jgi:hypothetical protein
MLIEQDSRTNRFSSNFVIAFITPPMLKGIGFGKKTAKLDTQVSYPQS